MYGSTHQLYAFNKIVKISFSSTVETNAATWIHFTGLHFTRRLAVEGVHRESLLIDIYHLLAVVRIQMYQFVLLEPHKVQRMFWLASNNAQTVFRAE